MNSKRIKLDPNVSSLRVPPISFLPCPDIQPILTPIEDIRSCVKGIIIEHAWGSEVVPKDCSTNGCPDIDIINFLPILILTSEKIAPFGSTRTGDSGESRGSTLTVGDKIDEE